MENDNPMGEGETPETPQEGEGETPSETPEEIIARLRAEKASLTEDKKKWQERYNKVETTLKGVMEDEKPSEPQGENLQGDKAWKEVVDFMMDNPNFPKELKSELTALAKGMQVSLKDAANTELMKTRISAFQEKRSKEIQIPEASSRSFQFENKPISELIKTPKGEAKIRANWETIRDSFANKPKQFV